MDFEQRLNLAAETYRAQGYRVVVRPVPDDLPEFAKDFHVEILARNGEGGVLASAKTNRSELEADPNVPNYAEAVAHQPHWRYDVIVLFAEGPPTAPQGETHEPSEDDIRRALTEVDRILQAGFVDQAFVAAWGALEAAMRRRLQSEGRAATGDPSPRAILNELYSEGAFRTAEFRNLERLSQARSALVHGFSTPPVDASEIQFLITTARMLLDESRRAKMTA